MRDENTVCMVGQKKKNSSTFAVIGSSLQTKGAGLLHSSEHLLVEHGERGVGREIQAVKAGVSPLQTYKDNMALAD